MTNKKRKNLAILLDFDGTVTGRDTGVVVLERFARGDWKVFDSRLEKGEISLEECMSSQFSLVSASKAEILNTLDFGKEISLRAGFSKFFQFCVKQGIFIGIVSAGLDFVIKKILELNKIGSTIEVTCPATEFTSKGIGLAFPKLHNPKLSNFKQDAVMYRKENFFETVVYIGDGISDYHAAKEADFTFAVKGSALSRLCGKNQIKNFQEFTNFENVIETIREKY